MRKFGILFLFLVLASSCFAQYIRTDCCAASSTPAQLDYWSRQPEFSAPSAPPDRPSGEVISVARLRHKPPRHARAVFERGLKSDQSGAFEKAAAEFAQAAALDPDFSEAHGNLGVEYTATGRLDDAVSEFQRALALDPATSFYHSNFAYTLIRLNRSREAEDEAREALALDPTSAIGHLLLGYLLSQRVEKRGLAETHLSAAAQTFPAAHLLLSRLYSEEGASQIAAAELKRFRQAGALVHKKQVSHNQAFVKP